MSVSSDLLPATSLIWRPHPSSFVLTAIAKATIVLDPGESRLADEHDPICEIDGHWDDNPTRSLFIPSDVAPQKQRVDVLAVGHAFAGQSQRVRSLVVRLAVGKIDKSIEVFSDRSLGADGTIYESGGFSRMPLVYERAAGGPGTWNPVGVNPEERERNGHARLPNLATKGAAISARLDPIGFGPIAASWPLRADRIPFRGAALPPGWKDAPLPDGFDLGYFNVAPHDQQLEALDDRAEIHLEHLHPDHARLSTRLPSLRPRATFEVRGAAHSAPMLPDTLWIDTDRGICTMTFRAQTTLDRADDRFRVRVEVGSPPRESQPKRRLTPTDMFSLDAASPAGLPFAQQSAPPAQAASPAQQGPSAQPTHPVLPVVDAGWLSRNPSQAPGSMPVPDSAAPQAGRSPRQPPPRGGTISDASGGMPWRAPATPFAPAARAQAVTQAQPAIGMSAMLPRTPEAVRNPAMATPPPGMVAMAPPPMAPPAHPVAPTHGTSPPPGAVLSGAPAAALPMMPAPLAAAPLATGIGLQTVGEQRASEGSGWASHANAGQAPTHARNAALMGAIGASNAAADLRPDGSVATAARKGRATAMQLLWFDATIVPRVRRKKPWKSLIDDLEMRPHDPELDEAAPGENAAEAEDRREIVQVLTRAAPSGESSIDAALDEAVRDDGRFVPPLLLLSGEIALDFDELEMLKAVVSIATPLAAGDEPLKAAVDRGTAYLAVPGLVSSADAARALTTSIRDAFSKSNRIVPATYLDDESERALLEKRAYQKKNVLGGAHLRALFFFPGSTTGIPTYLPETLAAKLPLFRRFPARILADVVFQADQYESHPTALKAGAVSRVIAGRA